MADFVFPSSLSNLYLANSLNLEKLVAFTLGIVGSDLDEIVGEPEWLHETVTNHIAVRRLVVMKDDHLLILSSFPDMSGLVKSKKAICKKNAVDFDVEKYGFAIWGVNPMTILGMSAGSVL